MASTSHTPVDAENNGSEDPIHIEEPQEQAIGFHVPGTTTTPSCSSKITPSEQPIMTDEEVEELQRKQLNALLEQEAMLAREKALKEGTVKFHCDSQREKVEAKRKASP